MIETLSGFADNILAIRISGKVTVEDYRDQLIPQALEQMARHKSLRIYGEIAGDFEGYSAGAMWADLKLGIDHWGDLGRFALVTDSGGIKTAMTLFAPLFPHPVRVFAEADREAARAWIAEA